MSDAPLILTLVLDPASQAWFDQLRLSYFPAERLQVGAHVTLFHALPGELEATVAQSLAALCADTAVFPVAVAGVFGMGRGVAFRLRAPQAEQFRRALLRAVPSRLTPQDSAPWSPHVTVQNKVAPEQARATLAELSGRLPPDPVRATGVAMWRYLGGPWEAVCQHSFRSEPVPTH